MQPHWIAVLLALTAPSPVPDDKVAPLRSEQTRGLLRLEVIDLTPRFLRFYDLARGTDEDNRFRLWQQHYDFAAVPPGPRGEQIARRMLDEAWPRYAAALPYLRSGASNLGNTPMEVFAEVAKVLDVGAPLTVRLTTYVGAFDNNAFTSITGAGTPNVNFAIEMAPERRRVILPHEMTHAVHP